MSDQSVEYKDKRLQEWTSDDVSQWLEDNDLFYMASMAMKELDGKAMCELLYLQHAAQSRGTPTDWINFLASSLLIDFPAALSLSYSLRQLLKHWKKSLDRAVKPEEDAPQDFNLYYP